MSTSSSDRKTPVDYGVQIRFINDLHDGGGGLPRLSPAAVGQPPRPKSQSPSKYGVAVRVQGIAGQPYVVLKDGQKGDSYGVQLRTNYPPGYGSLPRRKDKSDPRTRGEDVDGQGGALRRAQSHGSLLDRDGDAEDFHQSRLPAEGKSGSYGNLDGGNAVRVNSRNGVEMNTWAFNDQNKQTNTNRQTHRFDGGQSRAPSSVPPPYPYTSPPSSTHSSLGRSQQPVSKSPANQWTGRQANLTETQVTPDLLLDQGQSAEASSEEQQMMQTIYNILREGTNDSDIVIKHKVKVIAQTFKLKEKVCEDLTRERSELQRKVSELHLALQQERRDSINNSSATLKAELESCLDENLQLRELHDRMKKELNETQSELTQLRMDRENAEARARNMEDQLAELQDEIRKENNNKTDLMSCQNEMTEICQAKQKLEDTLRQRERELTALKGALKEEVASHDKELERLREQYSTDMEKLRSSMEQVSQSHAGIEAERLRVNASVRTLQQQLEDCRDESSHWMEQFHNTRDELRTTKQELLQSRLEKEEFEEELKELKERVTTIKQQTPPDSSQTQTLSQELQKCTADLQKSQLELEKQRTQFDKKVMEMIALKKSHQDQEAELKYEIDRLKEQLQRAKGDISKAQEKSKKLPDPATISDLEQKLSEAKSEASQLKEKLSATEKELEGTRTQLKRSELDFTVAEDAQKAQEEVNIRLKEKISRLEAQLLNNATESSEAELALHSEVRGLRSELDEAKRKSSRLNQEHSELLFRLENTEKDKDALKQTIVQLEEKRQQLEKALDKLTKEFESLVVSSKEESRLLKVQLEEQKEKARKDLQEIQRHGTDAQTELDRSQGNIRRMEEEMTRLKKELLLASEERDNHQLDKELLTNRLRHLEVEMENGKNSQNEKIREVRLLEDKLKRQELELEEERSSVEMLTERLTRSRDQLDQLRSELMQERSSKQDLELDKNAMERHLKELRGRLADMEGHSRSSVGLSQLENKILELEERLRSEEREKNTVLATQRRLERKLKDLNMTLDEERHNHSEQRDQLALKVKALKRQVDEGETELERIDNLRRKAQRDAEEQMELKEALQSRVAALETELKRKTQASLRPVLDSSALSSDDDDSLYDHSSITSILTESNLQTSSC
ncbi:cingulin isoform X2 [Boleophthalmus pectinirostris]|uniref:cingulin isoform X2 n=1 Tax=Boleophthalmus pectinirostris TaxID=150288 RepID=UPI0024315802|nr:cingulin isoform X2 [Boleophthalmus pectinirostris]